MSNFTNAPDSDDGCNRPINPIISNILLITSLVLLAECCITIIINRTKKFRGKVSTIMVTTIAVSKLFVAVSHGTFCVFYVTYDPCTIHARLVYVGMILPRILHLVSVCSLCSLTLDRYVAICWPLRYHNIVTSSRVRTLTIASWCIPALILILHQITTQLEIKAHVSISSVAYLFFLWPLTLAILVMYCLLAKEFRGKTTEMTEMKEEDDRVRYRTTRDVVVVVVINLVLSFPYVSASTMQYTCPSPKL